MILVYSSSCAVLLAYLLLKRWVGASFFEDTRKNIYCIAPCEGKEKLDRTEEQTVKGGTIEEFKKKARSERLPKSIRYCLQFIIASRKGGVVME